MKIKYIIYFLLFAGITFLIINRIQKNNKSEKLASTKPKQSEVEVIGKIVSYERFDNALNLSGSIEANDQIELRSEVSGLIRSINFTEGATVKKGQLLIQIDDRELQAQYSQAITRQKLASQNESRASQLLNKEAISTEEYEVAKADLDALKSQTNLVQAQLSKTKIIAPFSGKIGLKSVSVGQFIGNEKVIANLVNTNPIKIGFSLPEKYASQIKLNSEINFTVAGNTKSFKAKVYAIEPAINITTRTLQIRARANNENGELIPGLFANINLPLEAIKNAILLPTEAVIPVQRGKKVFITSNGTAKEVMIETESRTEKEIVVISGLKLGDTVLTSGIMMLKSGTKLKVTIPNDSLKKVSLK